MREREFIRLFLSDSWWNRLRGWRNKFLYLRSFTNIKLFLNIRLKDSYRHFFASHHYTQETWNQAEKPLLSLLVFCNGSEPEVNSFCQQLQNQTWPEFEVYFLITKSDRKLKEYLQRCLQQKKLVNWFVLPADHLPQTRAGMFNRALEQAQGKYIAILDCHDKLELTFLEESLLKLEAAPPHYFLQTGNHPLPSAKAQNIASDTYLAMLDKDLFRPLLLPRSIAVRLKGFKEIIADEFLAWEFYVNLVRHGYKGCHISGSISRNSFFRSVKYPKSDLGFARERIRNLHLGALLNNQAKLERRAKQYWQVTDALSNFPPLPLVEREAVIWLDLLESKFIPWQILPLLKEWGNISQKPLIVTVSTDFKQFFLYNKISGVRAYFPEEYHLQGKIDYFYNYLERRYSLSKISSTEILSKCAVPCVKHTGGDSTQKRLRILYASPWLITGGADTMTVDWFRELDNKWCEKYLVTTLLNDNIWLPKIVDDASGIFDLPSLGCSSLSDVTRFLIDFIGRHQVDILHIMNSEMTFNALPELKEHFPGLKVVAQFHCFDYFADGRRTGYPLTIPSRYDHLIDSYNLEYPQLGEDIMELYPYIHPGKFKVIHGCVDSVLFDPQKQSIDSEITAHRRQNTLNLLFIGRLDRQKQPLRLLEIAAILRREGVVFVMHIVGDGSLESLKSEFLAKLKEENLQDQVCFHGEQPLESLVEWYQVADIMLLTSDWEGVPMVLYQAMAMQVVPVVADVGGCAELVNQDCGYLISEKENAQAYVSVIRELLDDQRRQEMGTLARQRMLDHFSLAGLDSEYRTFYGSL